MADEGLHILNPQILLQQNNYKLNTEFETNHICHHYANVTHCSYMVIYEIAMLMQLTSQGCRALNHQPLALLVSCNPHASVCPAAREVFSCSLV